MIKAVITGAIAIALYIYVWPMVRGYLPSMGG